MTTWTEVMTLAVLLGSLCGCVTQAPVPDPSAALEIGSFFGYQAANTGRLPGHEPALPGRYVVLAFSGGGTRAAALAQGVLRELEATRSPVAANLTLLEAVDMVSSTSGGSVAAANFVLRGRDGYRRLDAPDGFLLHNGMTELVGGILSPLDIAERAVTEKSRIQLLSAMFRHTTFGDATFGTLLGQRPRHPPLLVLNAADMATGERFPLVQRQLDRLCLDLRDIALADAVSASAAFPIALTPMRLPDRSPCPAQSSGRGRAVIDGLLNEAGERRAALAAGCTDERPVLNIGPVLDTRPGAYRSRGRRQRPLLNLDACGRALADDDPARVHYVFLLDGGIADNLGLAEPLETLTDRGDDVRVVTAIAAGEIREVVVIAVNARSQPATAIGHGTGIPGIVSMAGAVIAASIDGRSGGLVAELESLPALLRDTFRDIPGGPPKVTILSVDFEAIQDAGCRSRFLEIGTNWSLPANTIAALQGMGSAILRASPGYLKLAGVPDPSNATQAGQARAIQACRMLSDPAFPGPPPVFGPG